MMGSEPGGLRVAAHLPHCAAFSNHPCYILSYVSVTVPETTHLDFDVKLDSVAS